MKPATKASNQKLMEEIAENFSQYLRLGILGPFVKDLDPNLNIHNIEKLLRIHFVLTCGKNEGEVGVIDFVEKLPERLRRIKTTVSQKTESFNGEVKGRILWNDTIKRRYEQKLMDKTLFVCDQREKNYNIPENLVLKALLQTIHNIVYKDLKPAFESEFDWIKAWGKDKELRTVLNSLFFRNVYLKKIDHEQVIITDRMLQRTLKSRIPLYRDAASLLLRYRKLMNYELDSEEAKELLKNTFIIPEKDEVLFELYWSIKIIRQFKDVKFQLIEPGSSIVAEWVAGDYGFRLYHDSTGSFTFQEDMRELAKKVEGADNFIGRKMSVIDKLEDMVGKGQDWNIWSGRPDILLEQYDVKNGNKIKSVLIGEVKYTNNRNYAIQGLKELLEYMALIKENGEYLESYESLFENLNTIKGVLFIDRITGFDIKENSDIFVFQYGEDFNVTKIVK